MKNWKKGQEVVCQEDNITVEFLGYSKLDDNCFIGVYNDEVFDDWLINDFKVV